MRIKDRTCMLIAGLLLLVGQSLLADQAVLEASDDSWVNGWTGTADGVNYGTNAIANLRYQNATWGNNYALYRFDVSTLPANIEVTSVRMRFYTSTANWPATPTHFAPIAIFNNTQAWDESTVVFTNAPTYAATAVETLDHFGQTGSPVYFTGENTITNSGGWLEFESAGTVALVQGWVDGSIDNYGISMMGRGDFLDSNRLFIPRTKEAAESVRPELIVTYLIGRGPVGAIRWDAWVGDLSSPGLQVERNLSPSYYHSRLPFFGEELSPTQALVRATSQAVIDKEIAFAHAAGLDFWAYVTYDETDPLSLARQLHQSSDHKMDMNFCIIHEGSRVGVGGLAAWTNQIQRYLGFFEEPNYQTVLNGRPLFFVFSPGNMVGTSKFASYEEAAEAFSQLRAAVTNLGMPSPYLVAMDFNTATAAANCVGLGFDAISNYAPRGAAEGATPYSTLSAIAADWWTSAKNTGAKVIPPLTAGWDRRPRIENPVSWEPWQLPGVGISNYYARPTPQELGAHVQVARDWCAANPLAAEADALIIYAWNEMDEGGWIVPTLLEQSEHLEAIQGVLQTDPDPDQDGMPDLWETWYFDSPVNASASSDADGDRSPDEHEYVAGTDPVDAQSVFALQGEERVSGSHMELTWSSVAGRTYTVQFSTNLQSGIWIPIVENITATTSMTTVTSNVSTVEGFYRVRVRQ